MNSKNFLKILSLILAVVLTVTFAPFSKSPVIAEEIALSDSAEEQGSITHSVPLGITDWSGTEDGAGAEGFIPRTYYTDASGSERDNMRPQISDKGQGVDGSYALKIGGDTAITRYETSLELANTLKRRKDHTVSLKVRMLSGSVDELKLGFKETNTESYYLTLSGSELSEDWQEISFVYTTARAVSSTVMARILISFTAAEGAELLIDDVSVTASGEELFEGGSFDNIFYEYPYSDTSAPEDIIYSPYDIETLKHDYLFGFEGDVEAEIGSLSLEQAQGTEGSYALTLTGDGAPHTLLLAFNQNGTLKDANEYEVAFKIKASGDAGELDFGICENKTVHSALKLSEQNYASYISADYSYYSFKYTTAAECSDHKNYIAISFNLPEGSKLYIDGIEVYNTAAEIKTELYKNGAFDYAYIKSEPIENAVYQPYDISEFDPISNYWDTDKHAGVNPKNALKNNENVSIVADVGLNGSYAMRLDGTGTGLKSFITIGHAAGALKASTEYVFEIKLRKEGNGKITKFGLGYEVTNWNFSVPVMSFSDEVLSTGGYICFTGTVTTPEDKPGNHWDHFWIEFTAPAGTSVLIDGIEIYPASDSDGNLFPEGTFDMMYYEQQVDDTPNGSVYVPRKIESYTKERFFLGNDYDTNNPESVENHRTKSLVSIAEGEGVKDSAAFKFVGDGGTHQLRFRLSSLGAMKNNTEYYVALKVKRGGNAEDLSGASLNVGVTEKGANHLVLGFSGNSYEQGIDEDWRGYYVYYTTTDECKGAWHYLVMDITLPEGAELYFDELEVRPIDEGNVWLRNADGTATNLILKSTFDMVDLGQDAANWLDAESVPENEEGVLKSSYNRDSVTGGAAASLATVSDAVTGHHVMKIGFNENSATSAEWMQQLVPSDPGDTHKVSFWIKVVGEVNTVQVSMTDSVWLTRTYEMDFNQYEHGKWTKVEFYYTDNYTRYECVTYRRIKVAVNAPAGSGVLIDNIETSRVGATYKLNAFADYKGNFETYVDYPEIKWSDRYIHKEGN